MRNRPARVEMDACRSCFINTNSGGTSAGVGTDPVSVRYTHADSAYPAERRFAFYGIK